MLLRTWRQSSPRYIANHNRRICTRGPRVPAAASGGQFQSGRFDTLKSLDLVLGSRDEEAGPKDETLAVKNSLRVPVWAWTELREPRVFPVAANALYYSVLLVYAAYYTVLLAQGPEPADDLLARLVNDHAAVASGDALRLFTSFFVADSIPQLVIALVTLATVGGELEALLGYSTFWAVWCVTVLSGSLADAVGSSVPITAGPAAGVGGIAAALLAHHLQNWRIEQLLEQARSGQVPPSLLALEQKYRQQVEIRDAAQAAERDVEASSTAEAPGSASASSRLPPGQQQLVNPDVQLSGNETQLMDTELSGPAGLPFNIKLPKEGQAFANLGGTAVAVLAALRDAADADAAADWIGVAVGFSAGGLLGWLVCPVYIITLVQADMESSSVNDSIDSCNVLLPVIKDSRPMAQRANILVGYAALLYAALGVWLVIQ